MFNLTSPSSHQMRFYLDIHLEDRQIKTVVIHAGMTDVLEIAASQVLMDF